MAKVRTFDNCIRLAKKAAGGHLNDHQLQEMVNAIRNEARAEIRKARAQAAEGKILGSDSAYEKSLRQFASKKAKQDVLDALIDQRHAAFNLIRKKSILEHLNQYDDKVEGYRAFMGGGLRTRKGSRNSVYYQSKANGWNYVGELEQGLKKEGLWELFHSNEMERDVANELWHLSHPQGKPGFTRNAEALKIANTIRKVQMNMDARANRAGAVRFPLAGYITKQTHNAYLIKGGGRKWFERFKGKITPDESRRRWVAMARETLDLERTMEGLDANDPKLVMEFLNEEYDRLASGVHLNESELPSIVSETRKRQGKKIGRRQRVIHFKDADAWLKYNEVYGVHDLKGSVISEIESMGREIALLENYGPNPIAMHETIKDQLQLAKRTRLPKRKESAKEALVSLDNVFSEIDGTAQAAVHPTLAAIGSGTRVTQVVSKLGSSFFACWADLATTVATLSVDGVPLMKAYHDVFMSFFDGLTKNEAREVARSWAVGGDAILAGMHRISWAEDTVPGQLSNVMNTFFNLNLMNWWNKHIRAGYTWTWANHLGEHADLVFNELPESMRRTLGVYGIESHHWDAARQNAIGTDRVGRIFLTGDLLEHISDASLGKILNSEGRAVTKGNLQRARDELRTKFSAMFVDRVEIAVPQPGAIEKAMIYRGTKRGTVEGEFARTFFQFKGFPLAMGMKGLGTQVYGRGADSLGQAMGQSETLAGLAHLIVSSMIIGYFADSAKRVMKGKKPSDPRDKDVVIKALLTGGGAGIYGDFLFGEYNRYGNSVLGTLAGPAFGQLESLGKIWANTVQGKPDKALGEGLNFAVNNMPNLFFTRTVLDFLILNELQERLKPGYLKRKKKNAEEEKGGYFIPLTLGESLD